MFAPPSRAPPPAASEQQAQQQTEPVVGYCFRHGLRGSQPPVALEPPGDLPEQDLLGGAATLQTLLRDSWLFGPGTSAEQMLGGLRLAAGSAVPAGHAQTSMQHQQAAAPAELARPHQQAPTRFEYTFQHDFADADKRWFKLLLDPFDTAGASRAQQVSEKLAAFAQNALQAAIKQQSVQGALQFDPRSFEMCEAVRILQQQVVEQFLDVVADFQLCLEAFGASKKQVEARQIWITECLHLLIRSAVEAAPEKERNELTTIMANRMKNELADLYGTVDVRAWPAILRLWGFTSDDLNEEMLEIQIQVQIMNQTSRSGMMRSEALMCAARLIDDLNQADFWGSEKILENFDDRNSNLTRGQRVKLLVTVLKRAPRTLVKEVLASIDEEHVDTGERDDEEFLFLKELLRDLGEDIRFCANSFFKMKQKWLTSRYEGGVAERKELSPEQICDHIEADPNKEELLKLVVNRYKHQERKFEIARILARECNRTTNVAASYRNDGQINYLIGLYSRLAPVEPTFGPLDEHKLVLPCDEDDILFIQDTGDKLETLKYETLTVREPLALGIAWFWRCFDPKLDLWPRASSLALTYRFQGRNRWVIVDLEELEKYQEGVEDHCKSVIREILAADHILKVLYTTDDRSIQVLQRGLRKHGDLETSSERRADMPICPLLPMAMLVAWQRRTRAHWVSNWMAAVWDFLALEVCAYEALGNFERRPMRSSQIHYQLTLAYCPLVMLRGLLAFGNVEHKVPFFMVMKIGHAALTERWGDVFAIEFKSPHSPDDFSFAGFGDMRGCFARIPWETPEWKDQDGFPTPDPELNLWATLVTPQNTRDVFQVHQDCRGFVSTVLKELRDKQQARMVYEELYQTYRERSDDPDARAAALAADAASSSATAGLPSAAMTA